MNITRKYRLMKQTKRMVLAALTALAWVGVTAQKGLKDDYKDYFMIGVAVNQRNVTDAEQQAMIRREFNSMTAENDMKPEPTEPEEGQFNWENADRIADFARRNGIKLRGHCLMWHSQIGKWMMGDHPTKEVFYQRMRRHINAVVERYKDVVYCWDVVNEAITDDATAADPYRQSPMYRLCGDEFIARAFRYAREADPKALLFYNDYNECDPVKSRRIYNMVKKMKQQGVPIDGIGMQGHYNIYGPTEQEADRALQLYSQVVQHIHVTELDIRVNEEMGGQLQFSRRGTAVTPAVEQLLADQYERMFRVFRKHSDVIDCVTFWNLSDRDSWLGEANYALPWDKDYRPKPAYYRIKAAAGGSGFRMADEVGAAPIAVDRAEWEAVRRAATNLGSDIERVTGVCPKLLTVRGKTARGTIVAGTLGKSPAVDRLLRQRPQLVEALRGRWEAFAIDVIDGRLVVAGSDMRGTIYGIYEVSRRIGVSPWYWWADIPVNRHVPLKWNEACIVDDGPAVKYRGVFINDEDWGLKPWAQTNYERELGDIGPRTYSRVCELLLRLRANMLAPAMHSCTGAFYSHPDSKRVCDSMGIIVTTSHCEPLLLNNAAKSEWDSDRDGDWNYKTNRKTILKKWKDRLAEAAQYENIYTMGMRGIHDAGLRGNLSISERVSLLDTVIADQRQLLEQYTGRRAEELPQIFVPYKETMDIYEHGLRVPEDVTLVWVDDNYGYMKRVSTPADGQRKGGAGVYYHLSYLGAPHDYLWLNTTPPVLMYEELSKAYRSGADRYWLLNVGDLKPMELGIETFMDMAWDMPSFTADRAASHQAQLLASLFGRGSVADYRDMLDCYYRLAWSRKPEYMGFEYEWDDPVHSGLHDTEFSFSNYGDAQQRLADYQWLSDRAEQLSDGTAAAFQLLQFPAQAAYQMNRKFLMAQLSHELAAAGRTAEANWAARQAQAARDSIEALNSRYNRLADGKWQGMMTVPPGFCALYHQMPELTIAPEAGELSVDMDGLTIHRRSADESFHVVDLKDCVQKDDGVTIVRGIGYDWQAVQLNSGSVSYRLPSVAADSVTVHLYTVPFWPLYPGRGNAVAISIDDAPQQVFSNPVAEYLRSWKDQVMRNGARCTLRFAVDASRKEHTLRLHAVDEGQMVQRVIVDWGGLQPTYVGPSPSRKHDDKQP